MSEGKRKMNKCLILIFMTAITLYSCAPIDSDTNIRPTHVPPGVVSVELPTITPIMPTPLPSITVTSILPQPTDEIATVTLTPVSILANEGYSSRICNSSPRQFDVREVLDMSILQLRFENEDLLTFEGWTQGPEPIVIPVTPEPTPDMLPGPYIYTRRLLTGGELSLPEGQLRPRDLDMGPLLNNPCGEECPLEIISQSPDGKWQLIQIHDWLVQISGIWLVGKDEMVRLIPYIPDLEWQWAMDSSLLWLVYRDPNLGGYTLVAQLDSPVITRGTGPITEDLSYQLDPWYYNVAFSPMEKVAISTTSFEFPELDSDELFTVDLTNTFTLTSTTRVIPGIVTVNWNEATQNFLLEIVTDSGVEIQDLSGNLLLKIPRRILEVFRSLPIPDEDPLEPIEPYFRIGNYAISSTGERLAVVHGPNLLIFECTQMVMP
jgi:hypothetical protein